jgi:succinoglycan biosynthesis transport protein ExoP
MYNSQFPPGWNAAANHPSMGRQIEAPQNYPPAPLPRTAPSAPANAWSLRDYWEVLYAHKLLVCALVLFGLGGAYLATKAQTSIYRAHGSIELQDLNTNVLHKGELDSLGDRGSSDLQLQTEIKLLQSESLIEGVARKLGFPFRVLTPDEPGFLSKSSATASGTTAGTLTIDDWVGILGGSLKVRAAGQTRLVQITFDSVNAAFSADFIKTLVNEYMDENLRSRADSAQFTANWLSAQIQTLRSNLEQAENALANYEQRSGIVVTGEKDNINEAKLLGIQRDYAQAQTDRITKQAQYELAKSKPATSLPEVLDNGPIREYQIKLTDLQRQFAELKLTVLPTHYKYERMQSQIRELEDAIERERTNILKRIQNEYDAAARREHMLATAYNAQVAELGRESNKLTRFSLLKREVDTNRLVYESMLQKVKEYGIASALQVRHVRIVDSAKVPRRPYRPNLLLNLALGLVGGLLLAVAALFVVEHNKTTFQSPGEVSLCLGASELGVIPRLNGNRFAGIVDLRRRLAPAPAADGNAEIFPKWSSNSLLADSFRTALASILFTRAPNYRPRVIVVTSAVSGEGKTMVSSYLAVALAEAGQKVVVIDSDLRKPRLQAMFDIPQSPGLGNMLTRGPDVDVKDYLVQTGMPGLFVLPAGASTTGLTDVLYSSIWPKLLLRLRSEFDTVVIDSPPMLNMPEARILGRLSDGIILVVRANSTLRDSALAAWQRLVHDNVPVLGTILNDWRPNRSYKGYRYGYYS